MVLLGSKHAFEGVCCIYQAFGGGVVGVRVFRFTQRRQKNPVRLVPPSCFVTSWRIWFTSAAARSPSTNTHVPGCDQTYSNGRFRPGLSCISLVWGVAPGDLENCFKFTGTDQDVRAHLSCLPLRRGFYSSFGLRIKLYELQIALLALVFFSSFSVNMLKSSVRFPSVRGRPLMARWRTRLR